MTELDIEGELLSLFAHTHTRTHTVLFSDANTHTHAHTHTHTYAHARTHTHAHTHAHARTHTHTHTVLFSDADMAARIMACHSPRDQKALGRKVKNFDQDVWKSKCRDIVKRGNMAKVEGGQLGRT